MTQRPRQFARSLPCAPSRRSKLAPVAVLSLAIVSSLFFAPSWASAQSCTPDPPMAGDSVTCTDTISTGYDVREFDDLEITIDGDSVFDDSGSGVDAAIRIGNETQIIIGSDSIINVTEEDGFGIQGDDNNFIDNGGTININGESGRGIKIDDNTTGILPNGAVNGENGSIFANTDDSIAMETGTNSGVATSGLLELVGDRTRGISAASREDLDFLANISNLGTINVGGDDGFGIIAGDDWLDGVLDLGTFTPQNGGIRNLRDPMRGDGGVINVSGDRSFGIFAGDESNEINNHNSFVINGTDAVINVTGLDSVGVSVGGNNYLSSFNNQFESLYTFQNQGRVSGGANAGALIQIRNFVAGFENRILNTDSGGIIADLTNLGTAGRGMAIQGSDGNDEISNLGEIIGDIDLGLGNDSYIHGVDATFQGTLSLGDGDNLFENQGLFDAIVTFGTGNQRVENLDNLQSDIIFGDGNDTYVHGVDAVLGNALSFGAGDNTFVNEGIFDAPITFGAGNDTYVHGADAVLDNALSFGAGDNTFENEGLFDAPITFGSGNDTYIHGVDAVMNNALSFGEGDNVFENRGDYDQPVTFGSGADTVFNTGTFEGDFEVGPGADFVVNGGDIDGDVILGEGDDTYRVDASGTVSGMILGGEGEDVVELFRNLSAPTSRFDLGQIENFEIIRLTPASQFAFDAGWDLVGTESFMGLTEVLAGAVLKLDDTRTFAGDLTIAPDGALVLGVDGLATPLTVEGATMVEDGGLRLNIEDGAAPVEGSPVLIIDAAGGLSGQFVSVSFNTTPVNGVFASVYENDSFTITFDPSLAAITRGQSQRSIAQNLSDINTAGTGTGEFQTFIDALFTLNRSGTTDLTSVVDGLSPEGYDAHTTVSAEAGRQVTRLLMDRPRECEAGQLDRFRGNDTLLPCHARRFSPWVATVGSFRSRDSFDNRPSYDAQVGGLVFGVDARPIGDLDLTVAIGSQYASIDVDGFGSSSVTMTDLAAHAAWTPGSLRLQAVASWGHGFHENRRRVRADLNGTALDVNQFVDSDHDSDRATLAVEAGYLFDLGPVVLEPLVGIDWAWINQRTINEEQAPLGLALTVPGREDEVGSISAGLRLSTEYRHDRYLASRLLWMDGVWRPSVDMRWRQFVEGDERDFDARFDGTPSASSNFKVSSEEDPGGVELGVGLSFIPDLADRLQFDLRYEAYVSENTLQQDLVGRVSLGF